MTESILEINHTTVRFVGSHFVKYSLTAHKRSHTGDKPYNCVICRKAFTEKGNLIIHERIHTGDKPYTCGICGKSFADKQHLIRHARSHIGEKPYGCEMCGRSFKTKEGHKFHQFKCPILQFQ